MKDEDRLWGIYIAVAALIIVLQLIFSIACEEAEQSPLWNDHHGIIRFHVVANSDSDEDVTLKLKVRDMIIESVEKDLAESRTIEATRMYLEDHKSELNEKAAKLIRDEGFDYDVKSCLGVRWIKEKTYGDITFPPGNYETFNIVIGKGEGENWWCVLFPPLCMVKDKNTKLKWILLKKKSSLRLH